MPAIPTMALRRAASALRGRGRGKDTILAHISQREADMLRRHGGSGRLNPKTGLPEFISDEDFGSPYEDTYGESIQEAEERGFEEDIAYAGDEEDEDQRDFFSRRNLGRTAVSTLGSLIPGSQFVTGTATVLEALFGPGNIPDKVKAGRAGIQQEFGSVSPDKFGLTDIAFSPDDEDPHPNRTARAKAYRAKVAKATRAKAKPKLRAAPKSAAKLKPRIDASRKSRAAPIFGANVISTALGGLSGNRSTSGPSLRYLG